jgi:hypothetical protein
MVLYIDEFASQPPVSERGRRTNGALMGERYLETSLDNICGKLSSFIAAWNTNWDGMQVCHELSMAVEAVQREISQNL